jgi:chromosome segregation ATPase
MNDLAPTITNLKGKIEKLVSLHKQLKQENDTLAEKNAGLTKTIEEQQVTITNLENEKRELVNSKNEEQNKTITETKDKINELVQEIDSCIALLNK